MGWTLSVLSGSNGWVIWPYTSWITAVVACGLHYFVGDEKFMGFWLFYIIIIGWWIGIALYNGYLAFSVLSDCIFKILEKDS